MTISSLHVPQTFCSPSLTTRLCISVVERSETSALPCPPRLSILQHKSRAQTSSLPVLTLHNGSTFSPLPSFYRLPWACHAGINFGPTNFFFIVRFRGHRFQLHSYLHVHTGPQAAGALRAGPNDRVWHPRIPVLSWQCWCFDAAGWSAGDWELWWYPLDGSLEGGKVKRAKEKDDRSAVRVEVQTVGRRMAALTVWRDEAGLIRGQ